MKSYLVFLKWYNKVFDILALYSTRMILLVFHFRCPKMPPSLTTEVYSSDMLDRAIANIEMIMSTGSLENEAKRYDELKLPHLGYIRINKYLALHSDSNQSYITGQQAQLQCQTSLPQRNQHGNLQKRSKLGKIIVYSAYLLVSKFSWYIF